MSSTFLDFRVDAIRILLRMDDPRQDPVDADSQIGAGFQNQCTVSSNNPSGNKIVKIKVLDTKPAGAFTLDSLSVEDVCYLLDYSKLNAITSVARENQFSGIILATGVESADDLKEFGIKAMFAQSLFKHILKWKEEGVPADIFAQRDAVASSGVPPTVFTSVSATNIGAGVRLRPTHQFSGNYIIERPSPPANYLQQSLQPVYRANLYSATNVSRQQDQVDRDNELTLQRIRQQFTIEPESGAEQENQQTLQRIRERQQEYRQTHEKKAVEIRDLQAAIRALQNDLHQDSGRMVLGLGGKYDCLRCCICKPDVARKNDPRPPSGFQLDCQHNWDLVNKVGQLAGEQKRSGYRSFAERCSDVLQLGKKRLQELQR
eukprot:gene8336-9908_t